MKYNRRQFLRNTSLATIALSSPVISLVAKTNEKKRNELLQCESTTVDYYGEGPFYTENPPTMQDNILASENEAGTRMRISGRVFNLECSQYLPNTIIDVWHANSDGQYDNSGYNLRGQTIANNEGFYIFDTIYPGKYLNGTRFRPSHIHFKITPPGFATLTTQLYFDGDPDLLTDSASSITSGQYDARHRIIKLDENSNGVLEGEWDIVIDGNGINVGVQDLHLENGIIYQINPNPISELVSIRYGVFKKANVSLIVFNTQGQEVAKLDERILNPGQYDASWKVPSALPQGHYFISLKINDLQVHYLKAIKM